MHCLVKTVHFQYFVVVSARMNDVVLYVKKGQTGYIIPGLLDHTKSCKQSYK